MFRIGTFTAFAAIIFSNIYALDPKDFSIENKEIENQVATSSIAAEAWLGIMDKGNYEQSWDIASKVTQERIKKKNWVQILEKTRKPLGAVNKRSILDIRTAKNPSGLPPGDYMVFFYNTSFANKSVAYELLTLFLDSDKQWKVVTYQVD